MPQGCFEKIELHRLLADLALEFHQAGVSGLTAGVSILPRLRTGLLEERPAPGRRDLLQRPPSGYQRVDPALLVVVAPGVQQLRSHAQLSRDRANLLARQDYFTLPAVRPPTRWRSISANSTTTGTMAITEAAKS